MVVGHAKPRRGFVSTSAYLAVPFNDSGFPAYSFDFSLIHNCCQYCAILFLARCWK